MADRSKYPVTLHVHKSFFDNIFEPARKNMQMKLGLQKLTQPNFTEFLAKSNISLSPLKIDRSFAPRKIRKGGYTRITI